MGNVLDFVPNLLNIPTFMLYSGADELVHSQTSLGMDQAFRATSDIYTWYYHPAAEHLTYIALDDWRKEAADTARLSLVGNPPRVGYVRDPFTDSPGYGIVHDRAYWISAITNRAAGYGTLDLTNHGCGGTVPATSTGTGAGGDPIPWVSDFRAHTGNIPVGRRPELDGTLRNISHLQIDVTQTCLAGQPITYHLTTDGPVTITFSDGRRLFLPHAGTFTGVIPALGTSRCLDRRRFRIPLRFGARRRVVTATVYVNGHRVRRVRGHNVRSVTLARLPAGRFSVRVVARLARGGTVTTLRTYIGCTKTPRRQHLHRTRAQRRISTPR